MSISFRINKTSHSGGGGARWGSDIDGENIIIVVLTSVNNLLVIYYPLTCLTFLLSPTPDILCLCITIIYGFTTPPLRDIEIMDVPTAKSLDDIYPEDAVKSQTERWNKLISKFKEEFGKLPDFVSRSPGRVNIIGEVRGWSHATFVYPVNARTSC